MSQIVAAPSSFCAISFSLVQPASVDIIRITATATLCSLFLNVASMQVGLGVRKTFACLYN